MEVAICIICSVVTSMIIAAVTTKILATHYFKIVGGHVQDICDMTKGFVESMKHRLNK